MLNDQDATDFYATWIGLSEDERVELKRITSDDDFVQTAIGTYPVEWKKRRETGVPCREIRRTLLVRILINFFQRAPDGADCKVATAFSLWLCDCVERYAEDLVKSG